MKKKIFTYSSPETEKFIEAGLKKYKDSQGIQGGFLLEKWILYGMSLDANFNEEAVNIISKKYR